MRLRSFAPVLAAYVSVGTGTVLMAQAEGCGVWQTLAVLLLGMVLPQPSRALGRTKPGDDASDGGSQSP